MGGSGPARLPHPRSVGPAVHALFVFLMHFRVWRMHQEWDSLGKGGAVRNSVDQSPKVPWKSYATTIPPVFVGDELVGIAGVVGWSAGGGLLLFRLHTYESVIKLQREIWENKTLLSFVFFPGWVCVIRGVGQFFCILIFLSSSSLKFHACNPPSSPILEKYSPAEILIQTAVRGSETRGHYCVSVTAREGASHHCHRFIFCHISCFIENIRFWKSFFFFLIMRGKVKWVCVISLGLHFFSLVV